MTLVANPVKPDPVEFSSSRNKNFASAVTGEIFNFTRPVYGFLFATFTYPAYIICICLKKAAQRPDRKGQACGKLSVTEGCMDTVVFMRKNYLCCVSQVSGIKGLVSKENVALCRWGSKTRKSGIKQVGKGQMFTVKRYQRRNVLSLGVGVNLKNQSIYSD